MQKIEPIEVQVWGPFTYLAITRIMNEEINSEMLTNHDKIKSAKLDPCVVNAVKL